MRIAQVLTASAGGIGRHVADVVPRLLDLGHTVVVFSPPATAATHHFARLGVPVRPLTELGRARRADVVHAHGYKAIALAAAVRPGGPALVGSWHNAVLAPGTAGLAGRTLQRLSARAADLTLGASTDLVLQARRFGARRAQLAPVAAPPVGRPRHTREQVRAELNAGDARVGLSIGRLTGQKNYPLLLDAAARFDDRDVVFWVAGDGPDEAALAARIAAERLPVRLLGARGDVADLLTAADAFVLTSHWEARALVAQEALQAGVPFVGTAVGGIPELVGDAGLLVPPGDAAGLAAALDRVFTEPGLADRLRTSGPARAAGWPDGEAVALGLELAYRSAVG